MASKEEHVSSREKKPAHSPAMEGLADAAKVVQDATEHLIQFSRDTAESAGEGVKDKAKMAEEALASGVKKSTQLIKKYPLESALVCFGVGVLAGMILKNRN